MKLTEEDINNLHDLFYMIRDSALVMQTMKVNNMLDWSKEFHNRIERVACPELYEDE